MSQRLTCAVHSIGRGPCLAYFADFVASQLLDLSNVPDAALRHEIATATIIWLWEIIARVDLPDAEAIPETSATPSARDQPPSACDTRSSSRASRRVHAREFLFSPETVAPRLYGAGAALPYRRASRIENVKDLTATALGFSGWMLPPS